jgi:predicted MFS family arabinose efflux permease
LYGQQARSAIATVTLFGGMAGTVCWPLTAFMVQAVGWRGACLIYAAVHLLIALPLQALVLARAAETGAVSTSPETQAQAAATVPHERALLLLLGFILTIIAGIGSIFIVHLLLFLKAPGIDYTQAVAIGLLFGPAQVGAAVVERLFGERYPSIWTLAAAVLLMAIGPTLLSATPLLAFGVVVYAAGYGISWIARGTVPLAVFGAHRFPAIMGRLALPSLTGQALAPALGAWWIEQRGGSKKH